MDELSYLRQRRYGGSSGAQEGQQVTVLCVPGHQTHWAIQRHATNELYDMLMVANSF